MKRCEVIVNIDEIQGFKKDGKSKEIIEDLLKQIEESKIKIGDKLPSERILAKQYNVSRIVIREVVSYLKAINVVESIQGSGNFVRNYPKIFLNYLTNFIHEKYWKVL